MSSGSGNELISQPLGPSGGFNWIFEVELLVCGILGLFFLFYFNRLFATVVAYLVRAWTWHKYRAHIDITSLQISLLGGRIFFKSARYHAHNITVFVHDGHITWRYWLRMVQEAEIFQDEYGARGGKERRPSSDGESSSKSSDEKVKRSRSQSVGKEERAGGKPKKELPCRVSVKVSGVEAFVYNQSPVYDRVVKETLRKAQARPQSASSADDSLKPKPTASSADGSSQQRGKATSSSGGDGEKPLADHADGLEDIEPSTSQEDIEKPQVPAFLRMLPISIVCKKAAAAVGNENTTSVVAAKLEKASGTVDAAHAGPLDLYKLLFNFDFENINVTMKPNRDFKQPQLDTAQRVLRDKEKDPSLRPVTGWRMVFHSEKYKQAFRRVFPRTKSPSGSLRTASMKSDVALGPTTMQDPLTGQAQWHGLARYLDDRESNEHDEWQSVEYAKNSTIADIPKVHMRFYFDMPGKVPRVVPESETLLNFNKNEDINGSKPPEYGMEFGVYGGVLNYGPWADRQRINMQQAFFPAPYVDAQPEPDLKPGDTRAWTLFKIHVSVEQDVTLRIPCREGSKDDQWQGRAERSKPSEGNEKDGGNRKGKHGRRHRHTRRRKGKQGTTAFDARPYGWIDLMVKTDTTVNYLMDMFARSTGYRNSLDLDVKGSEITSSVNHGLLWRTGKITMEGDVSYPAPWNTLRDWPIDVKIHDMELFILRDHFFLIIDLVNDWSSGAPPDFYTFVPYFYHIRMMFINFTIYLNVNDANIVNEPADFEKNDFLTLEGTLDANLDVSLEHYRPIRNNVAYNVLSTDMRMRMLSPSRSTFSTLLKDKLVAELPRLTLKGSFEGNMDERPGNTDTLRFDIVGSGLTLKAYGFLVRQLINLKENYFGDYLHFKTLEEFQGADEDLAVANVKTASIPKPGAINELDTILCIIAEDVTILAPTKTYSAEEFIRIELPVANLDLRVMDYYLDMGLQLSPLSFFNGRLPSHDDLDESSSGTQLFVHHMDMNGHRCFGLPTEEPTYLNQWGIDVGAVTGELSATFIHDLALAGRNFAFTFQDRENALPLGPPQVFSDTSFVQVRLDTLRIWLHAGDDALLLSTDPVEITTNDWAGETFSQRISVLAPRITFACVDARSASRSRAAKSHKSPAKTYAFLQTGVEINVVERKAHFAEARGVQQAHICKHDSRTNRAPFLQHHLDLETVKDEEEEGPVQPPAMPYPYLPFPVTSTGRVTSKPVSIKAVESAATQRVLRSSASSASLSTSIRAGGSSAGPHAQDKARDDGSSATSSSSRTSQGHNRSSPSSSRQHSTAKSTRRERDEPGVPSSTMAFSSSYAEPYFPLHMIEPDQTNVPHFEHGSMPFNNEEALEAEIIDDPDLDREAAQTSIFIRPVNGIRVYLEPHVAMTASTMLQTILPASPEEVMDAYEMSVLSEIAAQQEGRHGTNQILELQIGVPAAVLRVSNPGSEERSPDQVDVKLRSVETTVRISKTPSERGVRELLAVHCTAAGLKATLGKSKQSVVASPAINVSLDDILVWLAIAESQSIHATLAEASICVSGEQAEYFVDLVLRLAPVIEDSINRFQVPLQISYKRLLHLVYTLTEYGDEAEDPLYLSRMTYILRAFPDHFRNQESWKVLVRLRRLLQNLPSKVFDEIKYRNKCADVECPEGGPARALQDWAQWQNWDVPNVNQTLAVQRLLGQVEPPPTNDPTAKRTALTIRPDFVRVAIEVREKSNEVTIGDTLLGVEIIPPTAPTGLMLVEENTRTKTLVQAHTSSISIGLDWSAFGILEAILPHMDSLRALFPVQKEEDTRTKSQRFEERLNRQQLHLVGSMERGSVSLQTINLRYTSWAEGGKLSVLSTDQASDRYGQSVSVIGNADTAVAELYGRERRMMQTLLLSPSIYVDHVQPAEGNDEPPSITLAIAYQELQVKTLEQIPGLLSAVDTVVLDEVSKITQLVQSLQDKPARPQESSKGDAPASTPPKLHVALLAGKLQLEVSLLQTLHYRLDLKSASIRVAPNFTQTKGWGIDFDVGPESHCIVNTSGGQRHEQGMLHVPPINGHVGAGSEAEATFLSVTSTIQRVEIDATAIQGIIQTLGRPEVKDIIAAIKTGVEEVQQHVDHIMPATPSGDIPSSQKSKHIVFDLRLALLGITVAANAPLGRRHSTAEVEFGIGPLHAVASNRAMVANKKSLISEVRVQIRDIGARLHMLQNDKHYSCGHISLGISLHFQSEISADGNLSRALKVTSHEIEMHAYPDTAAVVVDVVNHMQDSIKSLDLSKEIVYLRNLRDSRRHKVIQKISGRKLSERGSEEQESFAALDLLSVATTVELTDIRVAWMVDQAFAPNANWAVADLVLSLDRIDLATRKGQEARLTIEELQIQLVKRKANLKKRSINSALLPEMNFGVAYWSDGQNRSLAFKATGKPLEVRLESKFMYAVSAVQRSIESATESFKKGTATWERTPTTSGAPRQNLTDMMKLRSLLVEADFEGIHVFLSGSAPRNPSLSVGQSSASRKGHQRGRYGQFAPDGGTSETALRFPGIAVKVEYNANETQPTVNGEACINASQNMLYPTVVPLILELSNSVKDVLQSKESPSAPSTRPRAESKPPQRFFEDESIVSADPTNIFGKTKVDLGLRVCRQEFGLTCQPIARVDANAELEDVYITINTIDSDEQGHFFGLSAMITKFNVQVKHVYSREPMLTYNMDSIVLSVLNSKQMSGSSGVSAVLKIAPTRTFINAKQLQDLLLFREIWLPPEIRSSPGVAAPQEPQKAADDYMVQRYQSVAAAAAFPWNATVYVAELAVELDLGQTIGKSSFTIKNLWASQAKSSNWEQNLCVGMDEMAMNSSGRMSGFIRLDKLGVRTSIKWPQNASDDRKTPFIQGSVGFRRLRSKAAFDYQAFAFGDIEGFDFLMYNVREGNSGRDRLVAVLDCEKAYVFCTATSSAQAVSLYQAFDRLIQDKHTAYVHSLKGIEQHRRRESTASMPTRAGSQTGSQTSNVTFREKIGKKTGISLHTDVVVTIRTISFGVFPSTFFDSQILKLESNNIQARFAVGLEQGRVHSGLGMTLGQLQVALASARRLTAVPKALEVSVDDVINSAVNAHGGTILRVPKVVASMQTWQTPDANSVDYIFKSLFEGKIDVGWNLSRINFIKGMWTTHSRSLASRLGKALPESAVKITAGPANDDGHADKDNQNEKSDPGREKITAEVNLPQSRYEYNPLEPPVIETPQLRDMGEATPPLEWIGLNRERLPNVTHQIIIVSLLEVAKEVEDAYERILGTS